MDLRKVVKGVADEPLFSSKWFSMLTALQHITGHAVDEAKKASLDEAKRSGDSTLWERNELIVRYLLEEGKLNLILRLLVEFKDMQRNEMFAQALQKAQADEPTFTFDDIPTIKVKAALFEQTLGVLIACVFESVESLQTLDMPLLIGHISRTLSFSIGHSEMVRSPDSSRRQEVLVVGYLSSIFDHIEALQEDRVIELICEHDILSLLTQNVAAYHKFYSLDTKKHAAKALSGILGSEDFKTNPDKYLTRECLMRSIVDMEGDFVKETFSDFASKKQVRPLLDAITKFKYKLAKP